VYVIVSADSFVPGPLIVLRASADGFTAARPFTAARQDDDAVDDIAMTASVTTSHRRWVSDTIQFIQLNLQHCQSGLMPY